MNNKIQIKNSKRNVDIITIGIQRCAFNNEAILEIFSDLNRIGLKNNDKCKTNNDIKNNPK